MQAMSVSIIRTNKHMHYILIVFLDVRFDSMTLSPIDPPCIIERTANQILSVNVTVESNATWSSASGASLWMMSTIIKSAGQMERMESIMLSTDNANMDIVNGTSTTFADVALLLDLSSFYCPDAMVELCVSINTNPSSNFTLSGGSTSEACLNIPCKGQFLGQRSKES